MEEVLAFKVSYPYNIVEESPPSYPIIKRHISEYNKGHMRTNDELRSGRPLEVTTPETIEIDKKIVLEDGRLKLRWWRLKINIKKTARHYLT